MNKIIIILTSFLISINVFAQNNHYGAFGAASVKYTKISNKNAYIAGGKFGWVINSHIVLGGGFYSMPGNINISYENQINNDYPKLNMNYGGLELEYIFLPEYTVHFSISILLAGGGIDLSFFYNNKQFETHFRQDLLLWEPALNIETQFVDWLHTDLVFSYRLISSFNPDYGITNNDLEGFSVGLVFKFGSY